MIRNIVKAIPSSNLAEKSPGADNGGRQSLTQTSRKRLK